MSSKTVPRPWMILAAGSPVVGVKPEEGQESPSTTVGLRSFAQKFLSVCEPEWYIQGDTCKFYTLPTSYIDWTSSKAISSNIGSQTCACGEFSLFSIRAPNSIERLDESPFTPCDQLFVTRHVGAASCWYTTSQRSSSLDLLLDAAPSIYGRAAHAGIAKTRHCNAACRLDINPHLHEVLRIRVCCASIANGFQMADTRGILRWLPRKGFPGQDGQMVSIRSLPLRAPLISTPCQRA